MDTRIVHVFLIGLLSAIPFLSGLSDTFVFDDIPAISKNQDMTASSPAPIFFHDFWGSNLTSESSHKSYRPFTSLTYYVERRMGLSPWWMKATSLCLHQLTTCSLYFLVNSLTSLSPRLTRSDDMPLLSLLTTIMFACHPVHVESVVSLVGRADILYSLFFILSTLLLLHWQNHNRLTTTIKYFVLVCITALSMLCKEQGILFLAFWFAVRLWKTRLKKSIVFSKPFFCFSIFLFCCLVFLIFVRMLAIDFKKPVFKKGDNPAAYGPDYLTRMLNFNYIYFLNMFILILPDWLCFDWAMGCIPLLQSFLDPRICLVILLWTVISAIAVKSVYEAKCGHVIVFFAFNLLLVPFLLSMNIFVYVGFVIAERNLYLSQTGFALLTIKGFLKLKRGMKRFSRNCLNLMLVVTLISFSLRSHFRSSQWRTELDLFTSGLRVCRNNAKVHYNIAKKLADKHKPKEAVTFYKEAVRLEPNYEQALNNLGNLLKSEKLFEEAEAHLSRATQVNPKFAAAFMNLGIVQQARNDFKGAELSYLRALELRSPYADCEYNLGNLHLRTGSLIKAEDRFRTTLQVTRGRHERALANLVLLLDETNRLGEAAELGQEAVATFPNNPEFVFNLANTLGKQGNFAASETQYLLALSLKEKAVYRSNLGVLYHRWGRSEDAKEQYQRALLLNPALESAKTYLKKLNMVDKK